MNNFNLIKNADLGIHWILKNNTLYSKQYELSMFKDKKVIKFLVKDKTVCPIICFAFSSIDEVIIHIKKDYKSLTFFENLLNETYV